MTFFIWGFPVHAEAQCGQFARSVVKPELAPFLHDGNLNATILGEGEQLVLKKTVFDGMKYRLVVMGVSELPPLRFKLKDSRGQVLFDNKKHDFASKWDFDVKTTQNVSVDIEVTEDDDRNTNTGGCVAVLFGIERN
ncbi:MAG: hypothetical protein ACOCV9_03905 [Marinilabiliaceae bacterium]